MTREQRDRWTHAMGYGVVALRNQGIETGWPDHLEEAIEYLLSVPLPGDQLELTFEEDSE